MKGVLALAAIAEAAGILVGRLAGIALIGLGVACWPGGSPRQPHVGMLAYGALATFYLLYVGLAGDGAGVLLWPAVAAHALIVALLIVALRRGADHA